jgi:hypothetical protein
LLTLGAIVAASGCGATRAHSVAVRVGGVVLTKATVDRRLLGMAGGRTVSDPAKRQALRRQALDFLISSQWLLGEAAAQGVLPSRPEVERAFAKKLSASFPGGEPEFRQFLTTTRQTRDDVQLEVEAELAAAKLRHALIARLARVPYARVVDYYNRHKRIFATPERREVAITNRKSPAEADQLKREVASGKKLSSFTQSGWFGRPETLNPREGETRREGALPIKDAVERAPLERAIFTARPNVLTGPVKFRVDYIVFEVKRIAPATQMPLTAVRATIEKQLAAEREHETVAAFIKSWRTRWTAKTDCGVGYVVQKCRQYHGRLQAEGTYGLS